MEDKEQVMKSPTGRAWMSPRFAVGALGMFLTTGIVLGCGGGITIYGKLEYSSLAGSYKADSVEIRSADVSIKVPVSSATGLWQYRFDKRNLIDTSESFGVYPPAIPSPDTKKCDDSTTVVSCAFVADKTGLTLERCSRRKDQPMILTYMINCQGCPSGGTPNKGPDPDPDRH